MVLLDLKGLPFLEEAQRFCSDRQISASSRKDPRHPPEFLKNLRHLLIILATHKTPMFIEHVVILMLIAFIVGLFTGVSVAKSR